MIRCMGIFADMDEKLHNLRHSLAHLLAAAVLEMYPDALNTIGPAVDNGFYYDFEFAEGSSPSEKDLPKIEKKMRELLKSWKEFTHEEKTMEEAEAYFAGNPYKLELIKEIAAKGEKITFYTCGKFTDLCRGGHLENPAKEIEKDSFKLDRIAGAYWRGDEKNKMLTRIYGLAFPTKENLEAYQSQIEEAKKRDHRKLGAELDLFTFSPLVGPGLPLWTPNGTILRDKLDDFVWELRKEKGYQRVTIPHITKKDLYEKSGHWAKFSEELFRIKTREGKEYAMKPMNCPHHTQIFDRKQWSYREMPQRYANTTMVYRDEQSGELGGLTRVLSITQDDAHVFARHSQVREEFFAVWDIINKFYGSFGFELRVRLSFHDPASFHKYLGTPEIWASAEKALRDIAKERKANFFEAPGEAAMYGPKLDFLAKDSLGREHQVATVQLDMNQPERFDLTCVNEKGEKERIVMIHCAIMGSIERFTAVLLEHTAGNLPVFCSPVQVSVIPIGEAHQEFAKEINEKLKEMDVRTNLHLENENLGKKIRAFKVNKIPYAIVIGDKELESRMLTVESRDGSKENISVDDFLQNLKSEIKNRK
jgi:threonyl-tRNA synthetase